jgi:hypothetical protein
VRWRAFNIARATPRADLDSDEELARWLQESGRRRPRRQAAAARTVAPEAAQSRPLVSFLDAGRRPLLLTILALAYLQYFFADTSLKIMSLPSLVFFVLG